MKNIAPDTPRRAVSEEISAKHTVPLILIPHFQSCLSLPQDKEPPLRTILSQKSNIKGSLAQKNVSFKADEFEELCYFSRELPPSEILLSPVWTTQDDLVDLTAIDSCTGSLRTVVHLSNFNITTAFVAQRKMSRVASVKLINSSLVGIVEVRNVAFDKKVTVRFTLDKWATFEETQAHFVSSVEESKLIEHDRGIDQFEFAIDVKCLVDLFIDHEQSTSTSLNHSHFISFAVCYEVGGEAHWDSNNNLNFNIELRRQFIKCKPVPILSNMQSNNFKEPAFAAPESSQESLEKLILPLFTPNAFRQSESHYKPKSNASPIKKPVPVIKTTTPLSTPSVSSALINLTPFLSTYETSQALQPNNVMQIIKPNHQAKSLATSAHFTDSTIAYISKHAYTNYPRSYSISNINDYGIPYERTFSSYATGECGYARHSITDVRMVEDNGMNGTARTFDGTLVKKETRSAGLSESERNGYKQLKSLYSDSYHLMGMVRGPVSSK